MELKQPEIIQILRKRTQMNQGDFGSRAFDTSYESGRTKVKNIELGRQVPTSEDLVKMAAILDVPVAELIPDGRTPIPGPEKGFAETDNGVVVSERVLDTFPGIRSYLEMLNRAVKVRDRELIDHIAGRLADLFGGAVQQEEAAH